ncbi:hypothetical protein BDW75DRAFT_233403 [Aspergillus navahoensis]
MAPILITKGQRFDTLQLIVGYIGEPYNACSVPLYTSDSFVIPSSEHAVRSLNGGNANTHVYSRVSNLTVCHHPTVHVLEQRMAALEGGGVGVAFSSGAAAMLMVMMTLARTGSNIVCSESLHGGAYHQFKTLLPSIGIEARFIKDGYTTHDIQALIDENTKLVFAETIGNPRFTVMDFETLSTVAHTNGLPLIVDSTFAAGGYFCRPFDHGADIIIHSTTKWIPGHRTSVGGVVIDNPQIDWLKSSTRYPQFHGGRAGTGDLNLYQTYGRKEFSVFLKFEVLRDTGACLGARAAHDMLMGLETLSVRCERQAANTRAVAEWLRSRLEIKWMQYPGFEEHESHSLARKYLTRGYGTVLTFGLKGGQDAALAFVARLRLIKNTANVGDSKTIIIYTERHTVGVTADLLRLSLGIEHVSDIIEDLRQALEGEAVIVLENGH